jgi:translation initiation factor 1 (eIF-1/SUI1)
MPVVSKNMRKKSRKYIMILNIFDVFNMAAESPTDETENRCAAGTNTRTTPQESPLSSGDGIPVGAASRRD